MKELIGEANQNLQKAKEDYDGTVRDYDYVKNNQNLYIITSILILIAVISVEYYFSLNREFKKELIDESINSYGKDKLTVVEIKSDKYFKVNDILISKDKISSGDYNNRIYMSVNSKKLFYYSTELLDLCGFSKKKIGISLKML